MDGTSKKYHVSHWSCFLGYNSLVMFQNSYLVVVEILQQPLIHVPISCLEQTKPEHGTHGIYQTNVKFILLIGLVHISNSEAFQSISAI